MHLGGVRLYFNTNFQKKNHDASCKREFRLFQFSLSPMTFFYTKWKEYNKLHDRWILVYGFYPLQSNTGRLQHFANSSDSKINFTAINVYCYIHFSQLIVIFFFISFPLLDSFMLLILSNKNLRSVASLWLKTNFAIK